MKRYEVEKSTTIPVYKILDSTTDSIICTCDSFEDANMVVKAMNRLYKISKVGR